VITLTINKVPTLFIKAFTSSDVQSILDFVRSSAEEYGGDSNSVLFIDTPITSATVEAVGKLKSESYRVVFRDHHGIDGEPTNDRERQVSAATGKLRQLLGDDCLITVRRLHPACSTLVSAGEFRDAVAIIADPDADGLTAAMKAAGITYEGLDDDAAKLDGEPQFQVTGTAISQLLAKGIATIPSYDSSKPKERDVAHQKLFTDWVKAVSGDGTARKRLEEGAVVYEEAVKVAESLARTATEIAPGVVLVDVCNKPLYDPGTLNALLEARPNCRVSVIKKSLGPIAAVHGTQYSLAVAKSFQSSIDLRKLVPGEAASDPETGVISNVSFLLHVSEEIWTNNVLPGLLALQS
jgi:hypothetical protein